MKNSPSELIDQAQFLGSCTDLVQGAGGNISLKLEDILWIKASGTRLKDSLKKKIFIPMDLELTRNAVLGTEDLQEFILGDLPESINLRPSIETAIHSLLPHKSVAHVHSVGAISISVQKNAEKLFKKIPLSSKKIYIPYCKPGIPLALEIITKLKNIENNSTENLTILLGNHGLIAATQSVNETTSLILEFEKNFLNQQIPAAINGDYENNWEIIYPTGTLNKKNRKLLIDGALTPDQVVFLGRKPFSLYSKDLADSLACITSDGSIVVSRTLSDDEVDLISSFIKVVKLIPQDADVNYLKSSEIDQIVNWDAEKWRISKQK